MKLTVEDLENGISRIALSGRMDLEGTEEISNKLVMVTSSFDNAKVVIDMSKVEYITSLGIGSLFNVFQAVTRRDGKMVMFGLTAPVKQLLQMSKMDQIFVITEDFETASAKVLE